MKKVTIKATDMKPEGDKAKKIYRLALDIIRRLDEIVKQKKAFKDVFLPEAVNFRNRLQDYCERLMFYNPLEYGRKAEELLWRKVYYDVIQLMKHNRKQMRPSTSLESAFRMHLAAATGYYNHLLLKLQTEYSLKLEGLVDLYHYPEPKSHKKLAAWGVKMEPDSDVREWAIKACHRCLIQLGDIARYQQDYDEQRSQSVAQRYYYQSMALIPEIGMPHNQLGTLVGGRCYNLDAIYHYLRCIVSPVPFDGAEGNMQHLFEKNRKRYTELTQVSPRDLPPDQQRSKDIKRFYVRFINLLDTFFGQGNRAKDIQELCQSALQDFNLCMFYQPGSSSGQLGSSLDMRSHEDKPVYLEDDMVLKTVVICMSTVYLLQQAGNKQVTAAIAFSLALFSHILNHVVIRLQNALYDLENPRKVIQVPSEDEKGMSTTDADDEGVSRQGPQREGRKRSLPRGLKKNNSRDNFRRNNSKDELKTNNSREEMKRSNSREEAKRSEKTQNKDPKAANTSQKKKQKVRKLLHRRRRRRRPSDSSTASNSSGDEEEEEDEGGSGASGHSDDSDLSEGGGAVLSGDSASELNYMNQSSSSDSDSDNLMVSQELRPGFSEGGEELTGTPPNTPAQTGAPRSGSSSQEDSPDSGQGHGLIHQDIEEAIHQSLLNNRQTNGDAHMVADLNNLNNNHSKPEGRDEGSLGLCDKFGGDTEQLINTYLQEFPADWLSDSSSVFNQTLQFAKLMGQRELFPRQNGQEEGASDELLYDKDVKVPPGFEESSEYAAVREITAKIASFNIETDTDTSSMMPTDTVSVDPESETTSNVTTESEMETETETESIIDRTEDERRCLERCVQVISNEGLLAAIKVFSDWMKCNQHIIVTCARSSTSLWARLSLLLNFFPSETELAKPEVCGGCEELSSQFLKQNMSRPLSEDIHLRSFPPLESVASVLNYSLVTSLHINTRQEAMLRVSALRRFGHFISKLKNINFHFDVDKKMFFGPVQSQTPESEQLAQQLMADAQARRNQLMKDMAQLRLKAEVSQLEGSLQSTEKPSLPPYLVPDASVLCDSLVQLRQLAHSARFIVIVPFTVIDHLDFLKKESPRARDAIRWLEAEFRKGNRYVRAQKLHEKTSKLPHKNLKKKDRDAWRYMQIVDCAKYLSTQTGVEEEASSGMVSVLTNHKINSSDISIRVKQVISSAQQEGVNLQNAGEFYKKWKEVWKNKKG